MHTALQEFVAKLSAFNSGQIDISELEDSSLIMINSELFENLDSSIQDIIYKIDMGNIEGLVGDDYIQLEKQLSETKYDV
jgi:hypothetical protein